MLSLLLSPVLPAEIHSLPLDNSIFLRILYHIRISNLVLSLYTFQNFHSFGVYIQNKSENVCVTLHYGALA
jgi:hypothetical protein